MIKRTSESLIIEELRGLTGSNFDKMHERELDYSMVQGWFTNDGRVAGRDRTIVGFGYATKRLSFLIERLIKRLIFGSARGGSIFGWVVEPWFGL